MVFEWTPEAYLKTVSDDLLKARAIVLQMINLKDPSTWLLTEAETTLRAALGRIELIKEEMAKHNG